MSHILSHRSTLLPVRVQLSRHAGCQVGESAVEKEESLAQFLTSHSACIKHSSGTLRNTKATDDKARPCVLPQLSAPSPFISVLAQLLLFPARQTVCENRAQVYLIHQYIPRPHMIPNILTKELFS